MNLLHLLSAAQFKAWSTESPDAWVGHIPFGAWLIKEIQPAILVELGTHTGNSYFSFCQSVKENNLKTKCYAVDTWQGDEHAGYYEDLIFDKVNNYHQSTYSDFSRLLRMRFEEALDYFSDGSIDLLHIDGLHTYEAVRNDFESWLPKMSESGIILFHDTNVRERNFGVWKLWKELQAIYPNNIEFIHSHGLGVIQLNATNNANLDWLDSSFANKQVVVDYFTSLGNLQLIRYNAIINKEENIKINHDIALLKNAIELQNESHQTTIFALNAKNEELSTLKRALLQTEIDLAIQTTAAQALVAQLTSLRQSTCWRITAPIRLAGHLLKGDFKIILNIGKHIYNNILMSPPSRLKNTLLYFSGKIKKYINITPSSTSNFSAINDIVYQRNALTSKALVKDPLLPRINTAPPAIDVSVVTYNSQKWVLGFLESFIAVDYPKHLLSITFVDNSSQDDTVKYLKNAIDALKQAGIAATLINQPNKGFGYGHNRAIDKSSNPFCLVCNIDLSFEPDALRYIAAVAVHDDDSIAAWEFRQKPYEHPKFYDPVTGLTNWNSHACILLRRSALEVVGGYDENLFLYGEDVELSYRLRQAGYYLRYCPKAVVWHYTYDDITTTKPLQYVGSTYANLYLRLKYGTTTDMLVLPFLLTQLLITTPPRSVSRYALLKNAAKLMAIAPNLLKNKVNTAHKFPFRCWDYEMTLDGGLIEAFPSLPSPPLVSIITRTYKGREHFLRQAMLSVSHQSYTNIEHIIVEDGGNSMEAVVSNIKQFVNYPIHYYPNDKLGRSQTGNRGLALANGQWCLFLDDDDLLFSNHIEHLANTLFNNPNCVAAYSLAWEVVSDSSPFYIEQSHSVVAAHKQVFDYPTLTHHNYLPIQSVLFEKKLFDLYGGFETDMDSLEDWVLWKKYAHNNTFVYSPKVTSMYRVPADPIKLEARLMDFNSAYPLALSRHASFATKTA